VVLVVLGVLSFVVPIPHTERKGFSAGDVSVRIQTQHSKLVSPIISAVLIVGGAGMMIAGNRGK
jgi:hypothetical protein